MLSNFVKKYNSFANKANKDFEEEIFPLLTFNDSINNNINEFKVLEEINLSEDDFAIPFFLPKYILLSSGVVIGYNIEHNLYYIQNQKGEIFTTKYYEEGKIIIEYFCAPNSEIFIQLLIIHLEIQGEMLISDLNQKSLQKRYKQCLNITDDLKYSFFYKVVCGIE